MYVHYMHSMGKECTHGSLHANMPQSLKVVGVGVCSREACSTLTLCINSETDCCLLRKNFHLIAVHLIAAVIIACYVVFSTRHHCHWDMLVDKLACIQVVQGTWSSNSHIVTLLDEDLLCKVACNDCEVGLMFVIIIRVIHLYLYLTKLYRLCGASSHAHNVYSGGESVLPKLILHSTVLKYCQ